MTKLKCLISVAAAGLFMAPAAHAAVYVGLGEFNGYITSDDGIFEVLYLGNVQVEFDTLDDGSNTQILMNLETLGVADWYDGATVGTEVVSVSSGAFIPPMGASGGGSGEMYDGFTFNLAGVTSTILSLETEWAIVGDELVLAAAVEPTPPGDGGNLRTPWSAGPMRFNFHGSSAIVAVPEPTTALLLGLSILGWAGVRSRRRPR